MDEADHRLGVDLRAGLGQELAEVELRVPDLEAAKREGREDAVAIACERGDGHARTIIKVRDGEREVFTVSVHLMVVVSTGSN